MPTPAPSSIRISLADRRARRPKRIHVAAEMGVIAGLALAVLGLAPAIDPWTIGIGFALLASAAGLEFDLGLARVASVGLSIPAVLLGFAGAVGLANPWWWAFAVGALSAACVIVFAVATTTDWKRYVAVDQAHEAPPLTLDLPAPMLDSDLPDAIGAPIAAVGCAVIVILLLPFILVFAAAGGIATYLFYWLDVVAGIAVEPSRASPQVTFAVLMTEGLYVAAVSVAATVAFYRWLLRHVPALRRRKA